MDCRDLLAKLDWAATPLGPRSEWQASLRATIANMLHTRQPMLLFWGPELIQFYNDSFVPSFGHGKHPAAFGQRARECWADAWPVIGAQIEAVMTRGEPAWFEDALVPIFRNGRMEEVFWTYSYSPAFDDDEQIRGTLVIVTEMTGRVLATRRLEALGTLATALAQTTTYEDAFAALTDVATRWPQDLPFALVIGSAGLEAHAGLGAGPARELAAALRDSPRGDVRLNDGPIGSVWPEPLRLASTADLGSRGHVVALGTSPRLPRDHAYRSYLAQVFDRLASTLLRIDNQSAGRRAHG